MIFGVQTDMATLKQITSSIWGIGIQGFGVVVEGLESIKQCIGIILQTTPGTDPLRPEFGSNVYKYIDTPVNTAIPNIKLAILQALGLWETRIVVKQISHTINLQRLYFNITYGLVDSDQVDSMQIGLNSYGFILEPAAQPYVVTAAIPNNPNGYRYSFNLIINGQEIDPQAPAFGFDDIDDLYNWVSSNYATHGKWYILPTSIVCYLVPGSYSNTSATIGLAQVTRLFASVEPLSIGQGYQLSFTPGPGYTPISPGTLFDNAGVMLSWAQQYLSSYGTWAVETVTGSFSDDFGDDFDTVETQLVLYTTTNSAATISVTEVGQGSGSFGNDFNDDFDMGLD